jgi:FkbM family methyltransferase
MKNFILGNKTLQKFWWTLYKISLKGLNYDRGHIPFANGEAYAIRYAWNKLQSNRPFVIIDAGANRGQYLQMVLSELHSSSDFKIYCFEPQKDAYGSLIKVSGSNPNIVTENLALGSATGTVTLYKESPQAETGTLYKEPTDSSSVGFISEAVTTDTLDHYCSSHSITSIDYLKLDVEGHEIEALKGAASLLANRKINFIQFEFGAPAIKSRVFLKDFFTLLSGYNIYRILPHGLEPINYTEYHELFLTTNYLSQLK